jgi:hypothetical protein
MNDTAAAETDSNLIEVCNDVVLVVGTHGMAPCCVCSGGGANGVAFFGHGTVHVSQYTDCDNDYQDRNFIFLPLVLLSNIVCLPGNDASFGVGSCLPTRCQSSGSSILMNHILWRNPLTDTGQNAPTCDAILTPFSYYFGLLILRFSYTYQILTKFINRGRRSIFSARFVNSMAPFCIFECRG